VKAFNRVLAQALQLTAWKHEAEIREVAEPDRGPGQVVVRIAREAPESDTPGGVLPFRSPARPAGYGGGGGIEEPTAGGGLPGEDRCRDRGFCRPRPSSRAGPGLSRGRGGGGGAA